MPTEIEGVEVHAGMSVVLAMLANLVNLPRSASRGTG